MVAGAGQPRSVGSRPGELRLYIEPGPVVEDAWSYEDEWRLWEMRGEKPPWPREAP